jgi:hypothetical protein
VKNKRSDPPNATDASSRLYVFVPKNRVLRFEKEGFRVEVALGHPELRARQAEYRRRVGSRSGKVDRRVKFDPDEQIGCVSAGFIADEVVERDMRKMAEDEVKSPVGIARKKELVLLRRIRRDLKSARGSMLSANMVEPLLAAIDSEIESRQSWFLLSNPSRANESEDVRIRALRALGMSQKGIGAREGLGSNGRAVVEQRLRRMKIRGQR